MKAKLNSDYHGFSKGSIVEVHDDGNSDPKFYDLETPEGTVGIYKWRVDLIKDPIEEKKKEIQDAKTKVTTLEKELAEMTAPKVGQRYLNVTGNKYVVTKSNNMFALVCYDGNVRGFIYGSQFHEKAEDIFCELKVCFTLIED